MAKLSEFAAKRLFRAAGIATPDGEIATTPGEARQITDSLAASSVLKAQIPAGKRGKVGAILFASDGRDAETKAASLFGRTVHNHAVREILVERKLAIEAEHYLAVFSNPATTTPTVIFSKHGGMEVEETHDAATFDVDLTIGFRHHHALDLIRRGGVGGPMLVPLAQMAVRLYGVYRANDCMLAEINPVAITTRGPIAADARINLDDDALFRHPELGIDDAGEVGDRARTALEIIAAKIDAHDHRGSAHFIQIDPAGEIAARTGKISIAFDGVGTGVSLAVLDELVAAGFQPRNFCDSSGNPTASKMYRITRVILAQPDIEGYVFMTPLSSQQLDNTARGIVKAFKELYPNGEPNIPCVLCFRGAWDETALAMFEQHGLTKSPWLKLLGRDTTEHDVAAAFAELHARWKTRRLAA